MAYLDSAGNVDPTAQPTVEQWQRFHAAQAALDPATRSHLTPPSTSLPAGAEKASKRG